MFRICFIDDDEEFEIPLFRKVFGDTFDIVTAANYADLVSQVSEREDWAPDLFVLDLYFPCGAPNPNAIEALRADPLSLENDNAQIRPAYRNHVKARTRLASILDAWNQSANGGLRLAEEVAIDFPEVPIVFYSRKATLQDAIRCMAAKNVCWVEKKPTGKSSAETIELTGSAQQHLVRRFEAAILQTDKQERERLKEAARAFAEILESFD